MRWMWIDQIVELEPGRRMSAIKNVTLAEEHLHDHFPACDGLPPQPVYPASLLIEGMAQTAGILVGSVREFREKVLLGKIGRAIFEREVYPGETVRFTAELVRLDSAGAATTGVLTCRGPAADGWAALGAVDLMFSHADRNLSGLELPEHNFVFGSNMDLLLHSARVAGIGGA